MLWLFVPALVITAIVVVGQVLDRRQRQRRAEQASEIALCGGFVVDDEPTVQQLPAQFRLLGTRKLRNVLRDRTRPADCYGFIAARRQGGGEADVEDEYTSAVIRLPRPFPHLVLRRQPKHGHFGRHDVELGDPEFDRRWIVGCDDPTVAVDLLGPKLRAWLGTIEDGADSPQFEISGDWLLVAARHGDVRQIPEMVGLATTFAAHLTPQRWAPPMG